MTGSLRAAFTSAAISYASARVFSGIGKKFTAKSGFFQKNGIGHILTHATVGGVVSELRGGKFGHGFFSAGITKGLTPHFDGIGGEAFEVNGINFAEATIAGILGGTVSVVTGGKFGNAAVTAAMGNLFNAQGVGRKGSKSNPHGERQPGNTLIEVSEGVWAWVSQTAVPNIVLTRASGASSIGEYNRTTEDEYVIALSTTAGVFTLGSGYVFWGGMVVLSGVAVYEPTPGNVANVFFGFGGKLLGPVDDVIFPGSTPLADTFTNVGLFYSGASLVNPSETVCSVPYRC